MNAPAAGLVSLSAAEVAGVQAQGTTLRIRLAAAPMRNEGPSESPYASPGPTPPDAGPDVPAMARAQDGFLLGVTLRFSCADWQGEPSLCLGNIVQGEVRVGDQRLQRLPVRWVSPAEVKAEFVFQNGEQLMVQAQGLAIDVPPHARWLPSLAC